MHDCIGEAYELKDTVPLPSKNGSGGIFGSVKSLFKKS